ncbi:MAG: IS30 family transposase [Oscillospiraceae bacterium]|nr:IS30 family transposase [Oscillospiraceae bacterium]MBR6617301.1 IS30 family transposase [Oscillospiraceae bacterium]
MKPYNHFTLEEREIIAESIKEKKSFREIARMLDRSPSSISREVKRNFSKTTDRYHPWRATTLYIIRRRKCIRRNAIQEGTELYQFIVDGLEQFWSPEIIAERAKRIGLQISLGTIYRAIRKGLFKRITPKTHLRRRGKKRCGDVSKYQTIHAEHTIHDRPAIVETRTRLGDWEGDTVLGGVGKGCLVTSVDRTSKLLAAAVCLDKRSQTVRKALARAFRTMEVSIPIETLTLDNGSEFAEFKEIEKDLGTTVYFADPHAPWQRGTNENTNDILRFFFPKGYDFRQLSDEELQAVVSLINNRPRKCLGFLSPLEFISAKCCT